MSASFSEKHIQKIMVFCWSPHFVDPFLLCFLSQVNIQDLFILICMV